MTDTPHTGAPPDPVLLAFGLGRRPLTAMEGGQGRTWRAGDTVLKPVDVPQAQLAWQADLFASLQGSGDLRVPLPIRSNDGSLAVDGWYAISFVTGRHETGRWREIIEVGERFHGAIATVERPAFLDDRRDPWSMGDRVAWGELSIDEVPETRHLDRLMACMRPLGARSQLVHGDLTGNVLFADQLPAAVIDLAPYYRPPGFAAGIVVADALVFEGADASVVDAAAHVESFPQYLLRALVYRAVTDRLVRPTGDRSERDDPYAPAVELALAMAS